MADRGGCCVHGESASGPKTLGKNWLLTEAERLGAASIWLLI